MNPSAPQPNVPPILPSTLPPIICWRRVLGLTAIQAAITLMWLMYRLYLPEFLTELGLPLQMAMHLMVVESLIAVLTEPIMGGISDQMQRRMGTRFPIISLGVILSAALFLAMPLLALTGNPSRVYQGIAVLVVVSWAVAMTVFRSPAIALLGRYASIQGLPLAASLLSGATGLIGTAKPLVGPLILGWGATATFAIGSITLLAATGVLRAIDPPAMPTLINLDADPADDLGSGHAGSGHAGSGHASSETVSLKILGLVVGLGILIPIGIQVIMGSFTQIYPAQFPGLRVETLMLRVSLVLAALSVPTGLLSAKGQARRMLLIGLGLTAGISGILAFASSPVVLLLLTLGLLLGLSFVIVNAIPFILGLIPPSRAGLGMGLYFGGGAAATSGSGLIASRLAPLPLSLRGLLEVGVLLLAIGGVLSYSRRSGLTPPPQKE